MGGGGGGKGLRIFELDFCLGILEVSLVCRCLETPPIFGNIMRR